ncbi:MAG TPA: mechanosensitive ion channel [Rhodospirillaceae bacterium]|nr:mechanosensitive ion channel [Rhodospirillaceae bacterium]
MRYLSRFVLLIAILFGLLSGMPAAAAEPPVDKAELQGLIHRIEDPAERARLVAELQLLVAADKSSRDVEDHALLGEISDRIESLSEQVLAAAATFSETGHAVDWLRLQMADETLRGRWAAALGRILAILAGGLAAEWLLRRSLKPARRGLDSENHASRWLRLLLAAARWLLDLVPVAVFVAVAYGLMTLPLLRLAGNGGLAAVLLVGAYALVQGGLVLAQALLVPAAGGVRALPLDDETANYLFIWARRLTYTGVWGGFAIEALGLLGVPKSGTVVLVKVLGLVVTTLLVILLLQNRHPVAAWIRVNGEAAGLSARIQGWRNRLADIWHILAAIYVIASFIVWALQVQGGFAYILRASLLTLAVLVAAGALTNALAGLVARAFAVNDELRGRFPQLELRVNRYTTILMSVVHGTVGLAAVLGVAQAWGADIVAWLNSELGRHLVFSGLSILAVLVGAVILWELVNASIERYLAQTDAEGNAVARSARARTLLPLARNALLVVLVILVSLIVLAELGINIAPLLAGAGVIGVAIGFGSQKLVQDVITGAFILFEDTIAVGDNVKIGDFAGTVEGMTIRTMRLRDVSGNVHTVPFSVVNAVTNLSRDFGYHLFDIGVSYHDDVDRIIGFIREVGDDMRLDPDFGANILDPIEIFGIERFAPSAVMVRGRLKTPPGKQWTVGREFNRRLKQRFDAMGVVLPYDKNYYGELSAVRQPPKEASD